MSPSIHPRLIRHHSSIHKTKKTSHKKKHKPIQVNSTETIDPCSIVANLSPPTHIVQVPQVTTHRGKAYNRFKRDNYYFVDTNKPNKPEQYKKSTMVKSHQKMNNAIALHFTKHSDAKYGVSAYGDKVHMNPTAPTDKVLITFAGNPREAKQGSYDDFNKGLPIILFARLRSTDSFYCLGSVKNIAHQHNPQNRLNMDNPTWLFETSFTAQSLSSADHELLTNIFDRA